MAEGDDVIIIGNAALSDDAQAELDHCAADGEDRKELATKLLDKALRKRRKKRLK